MDLDLNGLSDDDLAYVAQTGKIPMRNKESAIGGTDASTVNTPDTGTPSTSKSMSASASTFANPSDKVGADNVRSVTRPSVQQLTSGDFSMPIEDLTDAELSLIASEDDHAKSRAIRDIHMERRNAGTEGFVQPVSERADDKARRDLMDRAQYVVDNSDEDDPAEKKDREYAQKYIDWLGTNADKYAGLDEETKAGFAKNIGGLYDKRKNERGTIEKVWDSVVRGHNQNAVMVSQGARMFKPGGLTQEDIDELRGLQTVSEQIETANPRAVGSIKDIGGVGDALMFALESAGENLERGLIAGAGSAIGAGVAGALGAGAAMTTAGGILGGSAATMLQNTGEAVGDQLEESVPFSRSLVLAQGGLYSVLDGAFGTGPLVGKAFSKMVKSASKESAKSGIGAWARNVVTDASIKNALLDIGKASVMEGVTEAAQSGIIGRGRRYLQTGSMLKQGETEKEAWTMAADEFFGGLSSALFMGGFSRGMNAANARHVIGTNERIVGALSDDEAYKNLTPEMKLVVGRRIANDALLETYNNTVLTEDQRKMLIASNATIDRYLEKQIGDGDRSAEAAQAFLDIGRSGFAVEDFNDTVEIAKSDGAVSEIDNESMRDNEAYVSNVDGSHAGVRNTDIGTGISIDTVTDNEDNPIAFFVNNRPGMKAPFGSRMKFDTLEEAVKFANDLSIYNRARLNKIEAKANVIKSVFDKMYAGRGVNLAIFDTPNGILDADVRQRALEEDPRSPGFYNASDNTVYMFIDNVRSVGSLFTVLGHERAHKDIADYIKKCDKYNGSVSEGRKDLFKEGNVRGAKELAESEEAAGRPYKEGEIEAGEEILAERASIEQIAAALRSMDRGVVMRSAVRAIDAVRKMMGRSLGMSANVITDEDVRKELDFLWNRGMIGDGESSGFAQYTPGDAPGAGSSGRQYAVQGDVLENTESEAEAVGMSAEEARAAVDAENNERARKQRENADPAAELLNDRGREPGMPVDRDEGGANSVSVAPTEAVDTDVVNADADVAPVSETEQKDEATTVEVAESTDSETPSETANNGPTSAPQETAVIERGEAEKPAEGAREAENDDGDAYSVSVADDDAGTASESTETVADSGENSSETEKHDSAASGTKEEAEKSEPEKAEKPTKNKKQAKEIKRTTGDYLAELDGLSESDAERDIKERGLENDESAKTALILHNRASDHLLANIRWGRDAKRDTSVGREEKDADAEKPITAAQALLICERVSKEGYVYYPNESNGDNKELGGYWDYCSPYMARKIQEACVAWFMDHRRKDGNGIDNKRFVAAFDKILETIIGPEGNSVRNAISHRKIVSPLESDEMSRMYRGRIRDAFTPKGKKAGSAEDYIAHNPSVENDPTDLCFGPFYDFVFNVYPGIGAKKSDLYGKFDIPSRRSYAYELYMGLPEEIRTIMCKPGKPTDQDNWDVSIEEISSGIGGRYSGGIDGYELFLSDLVRSYEKYKDWVAGRIGSEIAQDEENARRAAEDGSKEAAAYRAELEARGKEYDAIGDEEIARIQEYMGDNLPRLASNIEVGKTYRVAGYNVNVVDMYGIGMELEIEGVRFVVDYFDTDVYNTVVNEVERKAKAIYERKKAETQAEAQSETKETENGRDQDVREEGPETVGGREEGRDDVRADVQETEGRGIAEERGEGESEERGEGRKNLALESVTAEELRAEEEKRKQKQEIEKRLAEPLKGGAVESGQTLLDLGGAEGEDLFNRTQTESAAKEGKSENGVEESDKQETEPAEQSMTPVEAYRVLRMDAAKSDAELNRLATAWEKNAKSRPEFAKMAQAARVLLADRAKKGKTDPRSDVAFDYKQNGVDKETVPSEASAESDNATTGAKNARTTSKADDEKVSITPKSTESGNNTPTEEGFRAWAVEKDTGEPLVFANDADRKHSREMFDGLVKKGLVDGKTGQTLMRWKRSTDETSALNEEADGYFDTDGSGVRFKRVTDEDELDRLNNDPKGYVDAYASAQIIDGKIYSPMAAYVDGKLSEPFEIGDWQRTVERPDLAREAINKKGEKVYFFNLEKNEDGSDDVEARYNPYWHSVPITSPLNDQFTTAYRRDNLVLIRVRIPLSDLHSNYWAEKAKNPVGFLPWKAGVVSNALKKAGKPERKVYLSRYRQVLGVVPNEDWAELIAKQLDGVDVKIPANVLPPAVREILTSKYGIELGPPTGNLNQVKKYTLELQDQGVRFKRHNVDGMGEKDIEEELRFKRRESARREKVVFMGSFFSGAGTIEDGLRGSVNPVFGVEFDKDISEQYRKSHGDNIINDDIRNVDIDKLGAVNYFHASPVCHHFSNTGDHEEQPLDILTARKTAEVIRKKHPAIVTVENAPAYRNSEAVEEIRAALREAGYNFDEGVYKASDFGGTMERKRYVLRAILKGDLPNVQKSEGTPWGKRISVEEMNALKDGELRPFQKEALKKAGIDEEHPPKEPVLIFGGGKAGGESLARWSYASELAKGIVASPKGSMDYIVLPDGRVKEVNGRILAKLMGLSDKFYVSENYKLARQIIGNGMSGDMVRGVIKPMIDRFANDEYDVAARDAEYMDAVKRGDMETAQRMVREAAAKAGYDEKFGFYLKNGIEIKRPNYVIDNVAFLYGKALRDKYRTTEMYSRPNVDWNNEAYNGDGKQVSVEYKGKKYSFDDIMSYEEPSVYAMIDAGLLGEEKPKYVFARRIGHVPESGASYNFRDQRAESGVSVLGVYEGDGFKSQNDGTYSLFNSGKEYVVSGQLIYKKGSDGEPLLVNAEEVSGNLADIKSADPVTYDDAGNVIPLSKRFDAGNEDIRFKRSGIYTGSKADYDKPSLVYVGTGEGAQVYGWGLYGSTVRGVADGYAKIAAEEANAYVNTKTGEIRKPSDKYDIRWDKGIIGLTGDLTQKAKDEGWIRIENGNLYEQTFFTNRAPGDESHLLSWYEPVSDENIKRIASRLDRENIDWSRYKSFVDETSEQFVRAESRFSPGQRNGVSNIYGRLTSLLGSPRAASEFLARADIDGIKYPADSYGGKSVKNGDEAGWNYVSFRDDNITVDHKWVNGEQRFKRSNREEMELATADNPNVAFANKEGLLAKTGYEKLFDSIDDARMMESGAAIANDPVRFNRVIDAALAGRAMTSLDFASLIVGYRNGLLRLAGVREGMDATNGKDRALEEQTADAALTRIMDAVRKAGNTAGRALQMLKVGIGLDTARDTYYYLVSEVKAIKAKQGLDTNLTAEEEKMLRNQVAVLEKKNEELNKAIEEERKRAEDAESKLAAAVMNGKSAEMGVFRLDENARRSIKSSLVNHTYSDDGVRAMLRAKALFGAKDVRFKAGEEGRAGGTSNADRYNEEMRDIIYQVLSDFKGDVQSVEKVFRENFGEEGVAMVARFKAEELGKNEAEVATNVEQKVRENGDNFKKREQDKSKTDPKKLLKNGKTVEGMRDALGKLRQKTVERISDFADNPENKRKALGRYLRKYNEFLIAENPSLSNEEIFDRMVEEAKRLDPDGNYDAAQMMYVLTGKHGFDIATREAMAKRLEDLKAAIMLAKSGHLVEAAKKAGVAYESESDKLAQHVEHLQEILDRNTRRLNEILAAPSSEDAAVVSEIESLKRDIADVLDAIKEQRRELAAIERKRKYAAFLEKRLADKRAELDEVISGRDPMREEALRKRLDAEIAETRDELTSVRRETNLLRSLQAQIDEINERIANNDFEPHPPRSRTPLSERSVRVQQLMIERDAARKRFASERARYQYRKLSKPVKFWKDFWEIMGESKAIIGSLDLSSMFRQGGQLTFGHPILFSHNFRKTLDAFRNESNASRLMAEIMMRPNADYYKKAGVEFTDYGDMAENADDRFILNHYRKITKNKFIKAGVRASERAFAMFLNLMRADVFDAMVAGSTYGSASRMTDSQLKAIGGFINVASQRGMIDKGDWLGKMIPGLNHVLWSPRNVISRFQFIANLFRLASPWANPYGDKTLRALFAKEIGRYFLGMGAMIAFTKMLADLFRPDDEPPDDIEFNPLSSQFMRVKFGNTRVDMMSGLAQVVTFGTRFLLGMNKNARGEFHDTNRPELVGRFLRSKLSPLASFVWDFSGQETFERQDIVWSKPFVSNKEEKSGYRHFVEQFIPLTITDILEQIQYTGYARTAVTSLYTILGAGVQAYDTYTYKQMSGDFHAFKRQYDDIKDAEERAQFVAKHPMLKRIGQIESAIKRVNYARRIMNNVKKANPNADLTYHENQVERNKKIAVNVMMGAPDPYNVD